MRVDIAWWDLASSAALDSLRHGLDSTVLEDWTGVPGLRQKLWLADPWGTRWGAVMVWDGDRPPSAKLPPNQAAEMIGRAADHRGRFEVVAAVAAGAVVDNDQRAFGRRTLR
jgi:trans-2,3-dihydro-3-hydroxyanthranilate isomerase